MAVVFLLGRPGSGKTTAFNFIKTMARSRGLLATRFREYTILQEMMLADTEGTKFRATPSGGFDILDTSVFDESSKRLEKKIQEYQRTARKKELIFIELARDDYSQAMKCFSSDLLKNSYCLFIEADVETCIKRIHWRVAHPRMTDNHFVSEHILRTYYANDNLDYMWSSFRNDYDIRKEVMVIHNIGSIQDFFSELRYFTNLIYLREVIGQVKFVARTVLFLMIILLLVFGTAAPLKANIPFVILIGILAYCIGEVFLVNGSGTLTAFQLRWNSAILTRNSQKIEDFSRLINR
jgi:adenylate kinase family enzyme